MDEQRDRLEEIRREHLDDKQIPTLSPHNCSTCWLIVELATLQFKLTNVQTEKAVALQEIDRHKDHIQALTKDMGRHTEHLIAKDEEIERLTDRIVPALANKVDQLDEEIEGLEREVRQLQKANTERVTEPDRNEDPTSNEGLRIDSWRRIVKALIPIACGLRAGDSIGAASEWMESRDWEALAEVIKAHEAMFGELQ